jgi:hypothetical protein
MEEFMKKKKIWLGMLVMVLAFGMTAVGCDESNPDVPKKLQITGISGITTNGIVVMLSPGEQWVAGGYGTISGNSVIMDLKNINAQGGFGDKGDWTDSGDNYICLWESEGGNFSGNYIKVTSEKISFTSETTIVEWSKFVNAE